MCGLDVVECLIERLGKDFMPHICHGKFIIAIFIFLNSEVFLVLLNVKYIVLLFAG